MADVIRIRRSTGSTPPGSLNEGELAYLLGATGKKLLIGPAGGGTPEEIAGPGQFNVAQSLLVSKATARTPVAQALGASELVGRGSSGDIGAIAIGAGLSFSGSTLVATGAIGTLDFKQSVRAAATGNVAIASALENGDVVDGVTLATGNRVLLPAQTDPTQNGIYVVPASGAASRAADFDEDAEVTANAFVWVEEGTVNADSGWVLTTNGPIVVGTDSLTFAQFTGLGQVTAGAGLTKTANTLNVISGDTSILVNTDELHVQLAADPALELNTGLRVKVKANAGLVRDADGLSVNNTAASGQVLVAGANGLISGDAGMTYNAGTDTLTVAVIDGATIDGGTF